MYKIKILLFVLSLSLTSCYQAENIIHHGTSIVKEEEKPEANKKSDLDNKNKKNKTTEKTTEKQKDNKKEIKGTLYTYKAPQIINVDLKDIDFEKSQIGFLVDGFSKLDKAKFEKTGLVSANGTGLTYLALLSKDKEGKFLSGKTDEAKKTIGFRLLSLTEKDIFNQTYSDLGVLIGDKDFETGKRFVNYRKAIAIKDSIYIAPYKEINKEDSKKDESDENKKDNENKTENTK